MLLTDPLNEVYKPYLAQLTETKAGFKPFKASNMHKDLRTKDIRMYEAMMKKLQAYRNMGIDHHRLNEVADYYDTRALTFSRQIAKAASEARKIRDEKIRSPARVAKQRQIEDERRVARQVQQVQHHFVRHAQLSRTGEFPVHESLIAPSAKKGSAFHPEDLYNPIARRQGISKGTRFDWRPLVQLDPRFQTLLDGNQHENFRLRKAEVMEKIKALGFKFRNYTSTETGDEPHATVINRIGHINNVMRHGGGYPKLQPHEKKYYDALKFSFTQTDSHVVPTDARKHNDLLRLAGDHVALFQQLMNSQRKEDDQFYAGFPLRAKTYR